MIELTKIDNSGKFFLNIHQIVYFEQQKKTGDTIIFFLYNCIEVLETPEEIKKKIRAVKGSNFILD